MDSFRQTGERVIYVDDLFDVLTTDPWGYPNACHLWADTEAELLAFAAKIGLRAAWLQRSSRPGRRPFVHFDLTEGKRAKAIAAGALAVGTAGLKEHMAKLRVPLLACPAVREAVGQ